MFGKFRKWFVTTKMDGKTNCTNIFRCRVWFGFWLAASPSKILDKKILKDTTITIENGRIKSLPYFIVKLLALTGDLLFFFFKYKGFPMNSYRLNNLIIDRIYNLEKTSKIAPNLPFTLEDAVTETVNWYKKNINKW